MEKKTTFDDVEVNSLSVETLSQKLLSSPELLKEWLARSDPQNLKSLAKLVNDASNHDSRSKKDEKDLDINCSQERSRIFLQQILDIRHMFGGFESQELDLQKLCYKILVNIAKLTQGESCSLYLVKSEEDSKYLEPTLLNINKDTNYEEALKECRQPHEVSEDLVYEIAVTVADNGVPVRNNKTKSKADDTKWYLVTCLPVFNHEGNVLGVIVVSNSQETKDISVEDVQILEKYLTFCGVRIENVQMFEASVLEYKKNQLLLGLARSLFQEQMSLDRLVKMIITEAKEMLKCERCTVFLLDLKMYDQSEIKEWVSGGLPALPPSPTMSSTKHADNEESQSICSSTTNESLVFSMMYEMAEGEEKTVRVVPCSSLDCKRLDIAKYVATTSEVLNLGNVKEWCAETDFTEQDGFQPKSMLSLPIYNGQRIVIGVAQLINKLNGSKFDESDVSLFEAFAIFCGIGIHNTKMYESAYKLMAKQKVALDCLSYHATANDNDAVWLAKETIPKAEEFGLDSYKFIDSDFSDSTTVKIVIRMFMDFNLVSRFNIPYQVLCRWALSVKKNYRPVKYHNWRHGLNVCQTMFTMLKTGKMERFMNDLEIFGLLVACLCHDLDHRGTNNAYQTKVTSPLAVLYSTSTMEHHHFDQCVMILSSDGNNIFQGLGPEEYRQVMNIVEQAILSTDLASYFEKRKKFLSTADAGEIDWQDSEKKSLLCSMLMTASDVSAIAKPWEVQHKLAKLVADEFFDQGDMEKLQLNITPIAMMDRERKDELPQMQVEFINSVCVPLYTTLSESFPWIKPLLDGAVSNREKWMDLAEKVEMGLTWIDHDTIEQPVEELEAGTTAAQGLELTVETLRCRQEAEKSNLVKKRSFRSLKSPVRPPVGFFNRKLSSKNSRSSGSTSECESSSMFDSSKSDLSKLGQSPDREDNPPIIVLSKVEQV